MKKLPEIDVLEKLCKSLAMLEAIISPDWEDRYYSFNGKWSNSSQMASMKDGEGNGYFMEFSKDGVMMKGIVNDSALEEKNNNVKAVPKVFAGFLKEPAFVVDRMTFLMWRESKKGAEWGNSLSEKDWPKAKAEEMMGVLDGRPETYKKWADEYYDADFSLAAIKKIYDFQPLDKKLIEEINPDNSLEDLEEDIEEIGYPLK
jgi:hypothetical protein